MCDVEKEEYSYRFVGITEEMFSNLQKADPFNSTNARWNEELQGYVARILLTNEDSCRFVLKFMSEYDVKAEKHGVWISLTTGWDQTGFTVPDYIMHLLQETKGALDVSLIFLEDD